MECVRMPLGHQAESAVLQGPCSTEPQLLGGGRWHWWGKLFTWKSRYFCGYLLFVMFILCFGRNQTPVLLCHLLQHHPKITLWALLHSTWSTHAPDSNLHLSPTAGTSVVIMPGVAHEPEDTATNQRLRTLHIGNIITLNQYSLRATGKHYPA